MFDQAESTIEFVGQVPPGAFIGALLLALVVALTTAGTYRWLAGRKPDALMLLVCLVLLANLACTLAAVGFVQSTVPTIRLIERGDTPRRDRIINLYDHISRARRPYRVKMYPRPKNPWISRTSSADPQRRQHMNRTPISPTTTRPTGSAGGESAR